MTTADTITTDWLEDARGIATGGAKPITALKGVESISKRAKLIFAALERGLPPNYRADMYDTPELIALKHVGQAVRRTFNSRCPAEAQKHAADLLAALDEAQGMREPKSKPPKPSINSERNAAIIAGVKQGQTYAALAVQHGIGPQRVGQIVRGAGVKPPKRAAPNAERNAEIVNLRRQGLSYAKIGKRYGLSGTRARNICHNQGYTA